MANDLVVKKNTPIRIKSPSRMLAEQIFKNADKAIRSLDKLKFKDIGSATASQTSRALTTTTTSTTSTVSNIVGAASRQLRPFRNMRLRLRNARTRARNRLNARSRARQRLDRRGYFRRGARSRAGFTKLDDIMDMLPFAAAIPGLFGGDDEGDDASFIPGGGDDMDGGPAIVGAGMGAIDPAEAISSSSIGYDTTGVEGNDVLSALVNIQVILNKARGQLHTIEVTNSKIAASVVKPGYQQARESLGGAAAAGGGARGFMQGVRAAMQNPVGRVKSGLGFAAKLAAIAGFLAAMFGDIRDKVFAAFADMGNAVANIANDISDSVARMFDSTVDYVDGLMNNNAPENKNDTTTTTTTTTTTDDGGIEGQNLTVGDRIKLGINKLIDDTQVAWTGITDTVKGWYADLSAWHTRTNNQWIEAQKDLTEWLTGQREQTMAEFTGTKILEGLDYIWDSIKPGGTIDQWIDEHITDKLIALSKKVPVPLNFQLLNKSKNRKGVDVDGVVDQDHANEFVDMEKSIDLMNHANEFVDMEKSIEDDKKIEKSLSNGKTDYVHAQALRDNTGNGGTTNIIDQSKKTINNGTMGTKGPSGNEGGNPFYDFGRKTSHIDIRVSLPTS
jgi:gas vesicle protein